VELKPRVRLLAILYLLKHNQFDWEYGSVLHVQKQRSIISLRNLARMVNIGHTQLHTNTLNGDFGQTALDQ
jgi:hypothetical protein